MTETTAYNPATDSKVDVALLQAVADQIVASPETHEQADYVTITKVTDTGYTMRAADLAKNGAANRLGDDFVLYAPADGRAACGTAQCVAGWALLLRGYGFLFEAFDITATRAVDPDVLGHLKELVGRGTKGALHKAADIANDEDLAVHDGAQKELGLSVADADALFQGGNSLTDVLALMYLISDGRIRFPRILADGSGADMAMVLPNKLKHWSSWGMGTRAGEAYRRYARRNLGRVTDQGLIEGQPLPWETVA